MPTIRFHDTLRRAKVEFVPREPGRVGMYVCGVTVQDAPHVGHAFSAVSFDLVRRHLTWRGYDVRLVSNLTDVDDKIIARAMLLETSPEELAERNAAILREEMSLLGVLPPDEEPRVSRHVPEVVAYVQRLVDAGHAYPVEGDVYFHVASFPGYGALSGQTLEELQPGARVEADRRKRHPLDFALWKAAKAGEPSWPTPWGPGRPGWHIECSAMATAYLGESFDIHAGGSDLIFPHHENEIAQSQALTGPGTFARHWMHNGLVRVRTQAGADGPEKMSKSLQNHWLLSDLRRSHPPEAVRLHLLQHHYRAGFLFEVLQVDDHASVPALEDAEKRLDYFYSTLARIDDAVGGADPADHGPVLPEAERVRDAAGDALDEDFNSPAALAVLAEAARLANGILDHPRTVRGDVKTRTLARIGRDLREVAQKPLGLLTADARAFVRERRDRLAAERGIDAAAVRQRLRERENARERRDYARADEIRGELRRRGVDAVDTPRGPDWRVME